MKSVVQLVVEAEVSIRVDDLVRLPCAMCNRSKYEHHRRGFSPPLRTASIEPIVKTSEWFGGGASASKCVLVSHEVARAMTAAKLRGTSFWPVTDQ